MNILALYTQNTLSLMRRVRAPFSVLTQRSHAFSLLQTESFSAGLAYGADVTVLQNWMLSAEDVESMRDVAAQRIFVVDCSDPLLLYDEEYRRQLSIAQLVTVPNEWMRKEMLPINRNTVAIPSCVDIPYFVQANRMKYDNNRPPVIGCIGPYDWEMVREALIEIKREFPRLIISAGKEATAVFPEISVPVDVTTETLPLIIHASFFGLCPTNGEHGWDRIWEDEYGILCRPVIASQSPKKETWIKEIRTLLTEPGTRAGLGTIAFDHANTKRSTKIASQYLDAYRKRLPQLLLK